jgi:predicted DNA-binding transcriptional regulator AlpA
MRTQSDIDDALIARFLGSQYLGRRYLRYAELEALGICDNRSSLENWIAAGGFPRGIKIPSRYGKTLVWMAVEVARHIEQRAAEREQSPLTGNDEGSPSQDRPHDSFSIPDLADDPRPAGHPQSRRAEGADDA